MRQASSLARPLAQSFKTTGQRTTPPPLLCNCTINHRFNLTPKFALVLGKKSCVVSPITQSRRFHKQARGMPPENTQLPSQGPASEAGEASMKASDSVPEVAAVTPEQELPPLTPQEHRLYDRLAVTMNYFHDHFRRTWRTLYGACESGRRPANMTLKQFIDEGISLTQYLTAHHNIEEAHLFPFLGRKMPEFRQGGKGKDKGSAGELLRQHREIHAGMDKLEEYLRRCRNREVDLELSVMKEKMDSWGAVLFTHLDQEVETLRAENMRKYWTLEEMRAIPI